MFSYASGDPTSHAASLLRVLESNNIRSVPTSCFSPGIDDLRACVLEVDHVARNNRHAMHNGRGGDQRVPVLRPDLLQLALIERIGLMPYVYYRLALGAALFMLLTWSVH